MIRFSLFFQDSKKDDKNQHKMKGKKDSFKENEKFSSNRERQVAPGEENRRPRRQNNQRWERQSREKGEGDQFSGKSFDEPQERSYRKGNGNAEGEGRMDRGGNRYAISQFTCNDLNNIHQNSLIISLSLAII